MERYSDKLVKYRKEKNKYKKQKYNYKINILSVRTSIAEGGGGDEEYAYYFNKLIGILQFLKKSEDIDKKTYKYIEPKVANDLIYKNYNQLYNSITKPDMENKLIHISGYPITSISDTKEHKFSWLGGIYHNPIGLWVSCGSAWIRFVDEDTRVISPWMSSTYIYSVELADTVKKISNLKEFEKFIKKYKKSNSEIKINDIMDWDRIKQDYDGLLICPYLGNQIWGKFSNQMSLRGNPEALENYFKKILKSDKKWKKNITVLAEWYRHWETDSGVVWGKSGIKNLVLVKKLDTYDILLDTK